MNSKSIYQNLCQSRMHLEETWKPVGSGLARHRILPGHQGGTYAKSNCTYLTHREHILAHYLLWRINGHDGDRSAYKNMKGIKCFPPRLGEKHTEETKRKLSEAMKGRKLTEEHKRKIGEGGKGIKRSKETKCKISESKKCEKWWNNGEQNKVSKTCPGPGWKRGRRTSKVREGLKLWNNGEQNRLSKTCPGPGWKRGRHTAPTEETRRKISEAKKGRENSKGHKRKIGEARKGKKWWNNGEQNKIYETCPGPGWKRGRF